MIKSNFSTNFFRSDLTDRSLFQIRLPPLLPAARISRSAAAAVDWSWFATLATCEIGWLKLLTYCMNAWISPMEIFAVDRQISAQKADRHIRQVSDEVL